MVQDSKILLIDAGNSLVKLGLWETDGSLFTHSFSWEAMDELEACAKDWLDGGFEEVVICGVASGDVAKLPKLFSKTIWFDEKLDWPIQNKYLTPQTLGQDRLAMASAAFLEFGEDVLLLTLGTCITYNIVKNGAFVGGAISPGWDMRYRAMADYTASLPLESYDRCTTVLGVDTAGSLRSGVDIALPIEIEGMIQLYMERFEIKNVMLCGGDTNRLPKHLKKHIFAPANFELHALKLLHDYFKSTGQI